MEKSNKLNKKFDLYGVMLDGNKLSYVSVDIHRADKHAVLKARNKNLYVELWGFNLNGERKIIRYWN